MCSFRRARPAAEMGERENRTLSDFRVRPPLTVYRKKNCGLGVHVPQAPLWDDLLVSSPQGIVLVQEEDEAEQGREGLGRGGEQPPVLIKGRVRSRASAGNCVGRHGSQSRVK
jgi:hypothetical protein